MRVRILERIEDSNRFNDGDDPLTARQAFTIGHRKTSGNVVIRVDKLRPEHGVVDLPDVQAEGLMRLGVAESADLPETPEQ